MEERGLTGNEMFKIVKEECDRLIKSHVNVENHRKTNVGTLYLHYDTEKDTLTWLNYKKGHVDPKYVGEIKNGKYDNNYKWSTYQQDIWKRMS